VSAARSSWPRLSPRRPSSGPRRRPLARWLARWRGGAADPLRAAAIDSEIENHILERAEKLVAEGMPVRRAYREAEDDRQGSIDLFELLPPESMRSYMSVVMRAGVEPAALLPQIRRTVHDLDPVLPISRLATGDERLAEDLDKPRFYLLMMSNFAAFALALAVAKLAQQYRCCGPNKTQVAGAIDPLAAAYRPGRSRCRISTCVALPVKGMT